MLTKTSQSTVTLATLIIGTVLTITPFVTQAATGHKKPVTAAKKPVKPIAGGANQVEGLNGKVGQMLFTGKWRFQVQDVQHIDTYTLQVTSSEQDYAKYHDVAENDGASPSYTPKTGYTFVALKCLAKNGQNSVQQLDFYSDDQKTALTDDQGNSYAPILIDMQSKGAWVTKPLLPGSSVTLTMVFAVPPNTTLKDAVVTLKNWSDHKGREVRVSLPSPASDPPPPPPAN